MSVFPFGIGARQVVIAPPPPTSVSSESGYFDFRNAIINNNMWECPDDNGGAAFATTVGIGNNPTIDPSLGAVFPDGNTIITRVQAAGSYTIAMTVTKSATMTNGFVFGNDVRIRSGSATALSQTVELDGVLISTEGDLFTALDDGAEHTLVVSGFDRTSALDIDIGRGSASFLGSVRRVAIISETDAGANLATLTSAAIAAVEVE